MKGFLSFNPLAINHVSPDVTIQNFARTLYLEILCDIVLIKFVVYFEEEISDFDYVLGVFLNGNLNLFPRTEVFNFRWLTYHDKEGCWRCRLGE